MRHAFLQHFCPYHFFHTRTRKHVQTHEHTCKHTLTHSTHSTHTHTHSLTPHTHTHSLTHSTHTLTRVICVARPRPSDNSFKVLRANCGSELEAQADCLENNNHTFTKCRKTQDALDECVLEKMVRLALALALPCFPSPHPCCSTPPDFASVLAFSRTWTVHSRRMTRLAPPALTTGIELSHIAAQHTHKSTCGHAHACVCVCACVGLWHWFCASCNLSRLMLLFCDFFFLARTFFFVHPSCQYMLHFPL